MMAFDFGGAIDSSYSHIAVFSLFYPAGNNKSPALSCFDIYAASSASVPRLEVSVTASGRRSYL